MGAPPESHRPLERHRRRYHREIPAAAIQYVLTALLVLVAGSCSTDADSAATGQPLAFEKADPFGLLDAFGGADAVYRLNAAVEDRVRDCMKEKGFMYQSSPPDVVAREWAIQERNLTFGLPSDAPRTGSFGIASSEAMYRTELAGLNVGFLASQTEAYREDWQNALDGSSGPRQAVGEKGQIVVGVEGCEPRALRPNVR
jgi:hypothetical protein